MTAKCLLGNRALGRLTSVHQLRQQSSLAQHIPSPQSSEATDHDSWKTKPIVINGNNSASLLLAQMLRRNAIPYILCDPDNYSPNNVRRNPASFPLFHGEMAWPRGVLEPLVLGLIVDRLKITNVGRFLSSAGTDTKSLRNQDKLLHETHYVQFAKLKKHLSRDLSICRRPRRLPNQHGVPENKSPFRHDEPLTGSKGRMLIGSDKFSEVRARLLGRSIAQDRLYSYPLLVQQTLLSLPRPAYDSWIAKHLDSTLSASLNLPPNLRLFVKTAQLDEISALLQFNVSRPEKPTNDESVSNDFFRFYRTEKHQKRSPCVQNFDDLFRSELSLFGSLPEPFGTLFHHATRYPAESQKLQPHALIMAQDDIPTTTSVEGAEIPAVLMARAAHFTLDINPNDANSNDELTQTLLDAIELGDLIIAAKDDKERFNRIPTDFYEGASSRWKTSLRDWEQGVAVDHGIKNPLPWTKITEDKPFEEAIIREGAVIKGKAVMPVPSDDVEYGCPASYVETWKRMVKKAEKKRRNQERVIITRAARSKRGSYAGGAKKLLKTKNVNKSFRRIR